METLKGLEKKKKTRRGQVADQLSQMIVELASEPMFVVSAPKNASGIPRLHTLHIPRGVQVASTVASLEIRPPTTRSVYAKQQLGLSDETSASGYYPRGIQAKLVEGEAFRLSFHDLARSSEVDGHFNAYSDEGHFAILVGVSAIEGWVLYDRMLDVPRAGHVNTGNVFSPGVVDDLRYFADSELSVWRAENRD